MSRQMWALVLAGGDGRRIRHLTTDAEGRSVPKQYFSVDGSASFLRRTLDRAERIVPRDRVAVVVARQHRDFWVSELADVPPGNVVVQPRNRGTGLGLLLGLLHIQIHSPRCRVVVLPSDHHVVDEDALSEGLLRAITHAGCPGGRPTLLGASPERADGELGWILPRASASSPIRPVVGFVEKPSPSVARHLAATGALVNSMILAADGDTLVSLFRDTAPLTVELLREHLVSSEGRIDELDSLYETLPPCDLSRDVLERVAERLAVAPMGSCGWTDIGTPDRLGRVLEAHPARARVARRGRKSPPAAKESAGRRRVATRPGLDPPPVESAAPPVGAVAAAHGLHGTWRGEGTLRPGHAPRARPVEIHTAPRQARPRRSEPASPGGRNNHAHGSG